MKLFYWIAPLTLLISSFVSAGEIYKCKIAGKVVFTDEKCEGEVVELKNKNSVSSESYGNYYNSSTWYYEYSGYTEALKISEKNDIPIFIYFHADWCGYCRKLERELINTSGGNVVLSKVVKVKISPERGPDENDLFKLLGGKGFPTVFIQNRFDKTPKKYRLMEKLSGKWKTKPLGYLSSLIDSKM